MALPFSTTTRQKQQTWWDKASLELPTGLSKLPFKSGQSRIPWFLFPRDTERPVFGVIAGLLPVLLIYFLDRSSPVTTPGVAALGAVALSTYFNARTGGIVALIVASISLSILFGGIGSDPIGLGLIFVSGTVVIALIDRAKQRSERDRRALLAAKSVASALSSLETVAATRASSGDDTRAPLFTAMVRAMVGVHRAHGGAFFQVTKERSLPELVSEYGLSDDGKSPDVCVRLAGIVQSERRPIFVEDLNLPSRVGDPVSGTKIRSLLAAPVIANDGRLRGVVMIGLFVRHRFTPTEIAKLRAFAGQVAGMVEATEAVDVRERLLVRAQEEQRRLEQVIAALPEAVVLASPPNGTILAANAAANALFGPIVGAELHDQVDWNDLDPGEIESVLASLRSGELDGSVEMLARRGDGITTPVLVSTAPIREADGTVIAIVASFRDIAALKQAGQLKDEFVSVVSHELRSPLTPIRGFVQLVAKDLEREGGHESHVARLRSIAGHVDRMTRLVDDLLDVSGLRSGSLDIRATPTELVDIVSDVVQVRSAAAPTHAIELELGDPSVSGEWDGDRLHQVIDNLVGNATKYSPSGTTIRVKLAVDAISGEAVVSVADAGPGISAEDRDRIFTAFYRTKSATDSRVAGLGLGLYICRELVTAHGGTIDVENGETGGAIFVVRLPRPTQTQLAA